MSGIVLNFKTKEQKEIDDTIEYIATGGIGEIVQIAMLGDSLPGRKVKSDATTILALCVLANEALQARKEKEQQNG